MDILVVDFESYYAKDYGFNKLTTEEYVRDSQFEVIGVAVKRNQEETVWFSGTKANTQKLQQLKTIKTQKTQMLQLIQKMGKPLKHKKHKCYKYYKKIGKPSKHKKTQMLQIIQKIEKPSKHKNQCKTTYPLYQGVP